MDVNALFEKYSIEEIRDIEKKTRHDIEKKKEDLRQMVGERYRELIEAADTIGEMKRSSESVILSIEKIQDLCQNLKCSLSLGRPLPDKSAAKDSNSNRPLEFVKLYGTSVSLKMLMDIPEKIWSALEAGEYLTATRLYLLSRYIYTVLQIDGQGAQIMTHFPILARQWATICHFKTTILQSCWSFLRDVCISDEAVSECLVSILLLEDFTTEKAFEQFITARLECVQQLFQQDQADTVIRSQISSVIMLISSTIHQIYTIFHHEVIHNKDGPQIKCNRLMLLLERVTCRSSAGAILSNDDLSQPSMKYLAKAILDFRPSLKHKPEPVPAKVLKEKSCYFLEKCMKNVNHEVVKLLGFISSIKGLASIRDDIWEILKQDERMVDWGVVSEQVLGRSLSVWNEIMREMFLNRVKEILGSHFESMLTSTKSQIAKVLTDFENPDDKMLQYERDLSSYIWTESAQDIPPHRAWLKVNLKMLSEGGSLMMKAHSYSPKVQALCAVVDQNLSVLLEDCCHYIQNSVGEGGQVTGSGDNGNFEPFNRLGDREAVQEFLQNACEESVNKLLGHLNQQLYACKQQLSNNQDQAGNEIIINRILLLGRVSGAICDLSPHLQACMSINLGEELGNSNSGRANKKSVTSVTSLKSPQNPRMSQMRSKLATFSTEAFSVWSVSTVDRLALNFASVLKDTSVRAILSACTHWDNIDIEEETEEGKKVKSTIRVPMQASWYIQTLLYNLCHDINKTGSHSIQYSVLADLMQKLTDRILASYESLLTSSSSSSDSGFGLAQNRSLQLWFDVKFLMNVLLRKDEAEVGKEFQKRYQKILERLESRIDPFDFDVFYPHLQNHLGRKMTRSNVLYGLLGCGDKGSAPVTAASSSQQEQHNILPLSTSQSRFSLLPLSIHRNPQSALNPIIQAPKLKPAQSMGAMATVPNAANHSPPPRVTSSSFLEQMSTMWFSNIKS